MRTLPINTMLYGILYDKCDIHSDKLSDIIETYK